MYAIVNNIVIIISVEFRLTGRGQGVVPFLF